MPGVPREDDASSTVEALLVTLLMPGTEARSFERTLRLLLDTALLRQLPATPLLGALHRLRTASRESFRFRRLAQGSGFVGQLLSLIADVCGCDAAANGGEDRGGGCADGASGDGGWVAFVGVSRASDAQRYKVADKLSLLLGDAAAHSITGPELRRALGMLYASWRRCPAEDESAPAARAPLLRALLAAARGEGSTGAAGPCSCYDLSGGALPAVTLPRWPPDAGYTCIAWVRLDPGTTGAPAAAVELLRVVYGNNLFPALKLSADCSGTLSVAAAGAEVQIAPRQGERALRSGGGWTWLALSHAPDDTLRVYLHQATVPPLATALLGSIDGSGAAAAAPVSLMPLAHVSEHSEHTLRFPTAMSLGDPGVAAVMVGGTSDGFNGQLEGVRILDVALDPAAVARAWREQARDPGVVPSGSAGAEELCSWHSCECVASTSRASAIARTQGFAGALLACGGPAALLPLMQQQRAGTLLGWASPAAAPDCLPCEHATVALRGSHGGYLSTAAVTGGEERVNCTAKVVGDGERFELVRHRGGNSAVCTLRNAAHGWYLCTTCDGNLECCEAGEVVAPLVLLEDSTVGDDAVRLSAERDGALLAALPSGAVALRAVASAGDSCDTVFVLERQQGGRGGDGGGFNNWSFVPLRLLPPEANSASSRAGLDGAELAYVWELLALSLTGRSSAHRMNRDAMWGASGGVGGSSGEGAAEGAALMLRQATGCEIGLRQLRAVLALHDESERCLTAAECAAAQDGAPAEESVAPTNSGMVDKCRRPSLELPRPDEGKSGVAFRADAKCVEAGDTATAEAAAPAFTLQTVSSVSVSSPQLAGIPEADTEANAEDSGKAAEKSSGAAPAGAEMAADNERANNEVLAEWAAEKAQQVLEQAAEDTACDGVRAAARAMRGTLLRQRLWRAAPHAIQAAWLTAVRKRFCSGTGAVAVGWVFHLFRSYCGSGSNCAELAPLRRQVLGLLQPVLLATGAEDDGHRDLLAAELYAAVGGGEAAMSTLPCCHLVELIAALTDALSTPDNKVAESLGELEESEIAADSEATTAGAVTARRRTALAQQLLTSGVLWTALHRRTGQTAGSCDTVSLGGASAEDMQALCVALLRLMTTCAGLANPHAAASEDSRDGTTGGYSLASPRLSGAHRCALALPLPSPRTGAALGAAADVPALARAIQAQALLYVLQRNALGKTGGSLLSCALPLVLDSQGTWLELSELESEAATEDTGLSTAGGGSIALLFGILRLAEGAVLSEQQQHAALAAVRRAVLPPAAAQALLRMQWASTSRRRRRKQSRKLSRGVAKQSAPPANVTTDCVTNRAAKATFAPQTSLTEAELRTSAPVDNVEDGATAGWLRSVLSLGYIHGADGGTAASLHLRAIDIVSNVGFHAMWLPDTAVVRGGGGGEAGVAARGDVGGWDEGFTGLGGGGVAATVMPDALPQPTCTSSSEGVVEAADAMVSSKTVEANAPALPTAESTDFMEAGGATDIALTATGVGATGSGTSSEEGESEDETDKEEEERSSCCGVSFRLFLSEARAEISSLLLPIPGSGDGAVAAGLAADCAWRGMLWRLLLCVRDKLGGAKAVHLWLGGGGSNNSGACGAGKWEQEAAFTSLLHLSTAALAALAAAVGDGDSLGPERMALEAGPGSVAWLRSAVLWSWGVLLYPPPPLPPAPTGDATAKASVAGAGAGATMASGVRSRPVNAHATSGGTSDSTAGAAASTDVSGSDGDALSGASAKEQWRRRHLATSALLECTAEHGALHALLHAALEQADSAANAGHQQEQQTDPFAPAPGTHRARCVAAPIATLLLTLEAVGALPSLNPVGEKKVVLVDWRANLAASNAATGGQGAKAKAAAEAAMESFGRWGREVWAKAAAAMDKEGAAAAQKAEEDATAAAEAAVAAAATADADPTAPPKAPPELLPRLRRPDTAVQNAYYHETVWTLLRLFELFERERAREARELGTEDAAAASAAAASAAAPDKRRRSRSRGGENEDVCGMLATAGGEAAVQGALHPAGVAAALAPPVARLANSVRTPSKREQRRWGAFLLPAFRSLGEAVPAAGDSEARAARRQAVAAPELAAVGQAVSAAAALASQIVRMRWMDAGALAGARAKARASRAAEAGAHAASAADAAAGRRLLSLRRFGTAASAFADDTEQRVAGREYMRHLAFTEAARRAAAVEAGAARARLRRTLRAVTLCTPDAASAILVSPSPATGWQPREVLCTWQGGGGGADTSPALGGIPAPRSLLVRSWSRHGAAALVGTGGCGAAGSYTAARLPWACQRLHPHVATAVGKSAASAALQCQWLYRSPAAMVLPLGTIEGEVLVSQQRLVFVHHEALPPPDASSQRDGYAAPMPTLWRWRRWSWRIAALTCATRRRFLLMGDAALELHFDGNCSSISASVCSDRNVKPQFDSANAPDDEWEQNGTEDEDEEDSAEASGAAAAIATPSIMLHFVLAAHASAARREAAAKAAVAAAAKVAAAKSGAEREGSGRDSWADRWASTFRAEGAVGGASPLSDSGSTSSSGSCGGRSGAMTPQGQRCEHPPCPPRRREAAAACRALLLALLRHPRATRLRSAMCGVAEGLLLAEGAAKTASEMKAATAAREAATAARAAAAHSLARADAAVAALAAAATARGAGVSADQLLAVAALVGASEESSTPAAVGDESAISATAYSTARPLLGTAPLTPHRFRDLAASVLLRGSPARPLSYWQHAPQQMPNEDGAARTALGDFAASSGVLAGGTTSEVEGTPPLPTPKHTAARDAARVDEILWAAADAGRRFRCGGATVAWRRGLLSSFSYLTLVNDAAGRTTRDLDQYPVFPWVLSAQAMGAAGADNAADGAAATAGADAPSTLDLTCAATYRRLSLPVGALTAARLQGFNDRADALAMIGECGDIGEHVDAGDESVEDSDENVTAAEQGAEAGEKTASGALAGSLATNRIHQLGRPSWVRDSSGGSESGVNGIDDDESEWYLSDDEAAREDAALDGATSGADGQMTLSRRFLYGTHYSSSAATLFYLLRLEPYTSYARALQGGARAPAGELLGMQVALPEWACLRPLRGRLDHADRLLNSMTEAWENCLQSSGDVKELVPELFATPEYLEWTPANARHASSDASGGGAGAGLGVRQCGAVVRDVGLPRWARGSAHTFVRMHRAALDGATVGAALASWINLIFGATQQSEGAHSLFHPLSYEGAVELASVADPVMREGARSQVSNFGQTPRAVFAKMHPPRLAPNAAAAARWALPGCMDAGGADVAVAVAEGLRDGVYRRYRCFARDQRRRDARRRDRSATKAVRASALSHSDSWLSAKVGEAMSSWSSFGALGTLLGRQSSSSSSDSLGQHRTSPLAACKGSQPQPFGDAIATLHSSDSPHSWNFEGSSEGGDALVANDISDDVADLDVQIDALLTPRGGGSAAAEVEDGRAATAPPPPEWQLLAGGETACAVVALLASPSPLGGTSRVIAVDAAGGTRQLVLAAADCSETFELRLELRAERSTAVMQLVPPPMASPVTQEQGQGQQIPPLPQRVAVLPLPLPGSQPWLLQWRTHPLLVAASGGLGGRALRVAQLPISSSGGDDSSDGAPVDFQVMSAQRVPVTPGGAGVASTAVAASLSPGFRAGRGGTAAMAAAAAAAGVTVGAVATGFDNGTIAVWRVTPRAASSSGGDCEWAVGADGRGKPWRMLFGRAGARVRCVALDIGLGVVGSACEGTAGSISLHALHDGLPLRHLRAPGAAATAPVLALAVSALGYVTAHFSGGGGEEDEQRRAWSHTWSVNGALLGSAAHDEPCRSFCCGGRDGRLLVTCEHDHVALRWTATLAHLRTLALGTAAMAGVRLRCAILWDDESCVVAGGDNGTVLLHALPPSENASFEPDR